MTLYEETILALQKIHGGIPVSGLSSRLHFGEHKSKFKGEGHDFYQTREYDPGTDSIDRVIWHRAAEPGDELHVRESIKTKDVPLILLADLSSSIDFGTKTLSKRKLLLECAGILGLTAVHDQDQVGLLGFTDTVVLDHAPKGGVNYVYHLLSRLCGFLEDVPEHERRKTDFLKALATIDQRFPGSCFIVVLSDCIGWENIAESGLLARRNYEHDFIFFILDDPDEFALTSRSGFLSVENVETKEIVTVSIRKLRHLREEIEARQGRLRSGLQKIGIDSAVLTYGDHFRQLTEFFLERKEGI